MSTVPRFALYGMDSSPQWAELVNHERIPERSSAYNWEIDPHVHDGLLQVLHVEQCGPGGEILMDGYRWPIDPPCLIIVPSGVVHGFRFRSDVDGPVITAAQRPLESLLAAIAPELLPHVRTPRVMPVDVTSPYAAAMTPLFSALAHESRQIAAGQMVASMALLASLFVQFARLSEAAGAAGGDPRSRRARLIEQFRRLVSEQFRSNRSVNGYARLLGVTAGHLGRMCRDALGLSPQEVINARVMHEAQRELIYSSSSIKQVAAELGYDDEAYFGRFFKKQTGHRPTEFREMARRRLAQG